MGARPSSFKSGGGFLNNVDATLVGYKFSKTFQGGKATAKDSEKTPLYFIPEFQVDGADDIADTNLYAGSGDMFTIEDDGTTLSYDADDASIWSKSPAGVFLASLTEQAPSLEATLPDIGEPINYQSLIGVRVRLVQEVDEEATKRLGKRVDPKNPDKSYNRTVLKVARVIALPGETSSKATTTKAAKPATRATGGTTAVATLAADTLVDVISAAGGTIAKSRVKLAVFRALDGNPMQDAVQRLVSTDEFINSAAGWTVSADGKQLSA